MRFHRKHGKARKDKGADQSRKQGRFRMRLRRIRHFRVRSVSIPDIPIRTMAPNMVTMSAAAFGILAILFAQHIYLLERMGLDKTRWYDEWSAPLVCLFISGVCDFCDGGVARLLKATSKIGAELDSLADFVNFGVAPALILYYWILPHLADLPRNSCLTSPITLAVIAIFYAMCCAFRLARFNTLLAEPTAPRWRRFFMGAPAPGGAYLLLTPLLLWVGFGPSKAGFLRSPYLGAFLLLAVGALMVSRVPTFALKHFHASRRFLIGAACVLLAGCAFLGFCETVGIVGVLYMATIPFFAVVGMNLSDKNEDEAAPDAPPGGEAQQGGAEPAGGGNAGQ